MKKLLTLLITSCMLCAGSAAADTVKENDIQLLTDLGIVGEEIKSSLNQPMQRIAFVDMFSSIENVKNASSGTTAAFQDVDFGADYGDALAWLYMSGAISNGENFYPEENITYEQAAKIMVSVLGYGKEAEIEGGYPSGYMNVAARLELLEGISGSEFTAADACRMYANALEASAVSVRAEAYEGKEVEKSMLERYYDTSYRKGKMTKNTLTALSDNLSASDKTVAVDANEYVCDGRYNDLIGREVVVYYKIDGERENEVVGIYETDKNNVINFRTEEDTQFSNFTYSVYIDGKYEKYSITRAVDVVYNGRIYTQYAESDFLPQNGDVTLVDCNNDDEYETVIINSYEIYFASNGTSDGIIYDAMGKPFIDLRESCDYIVTEGEKEVALSAVTVDTLLEIRESKGDAKKLYQINICRDAVSGIITAVEDSYRKVTVGDVEYTFLDSLRDLIIAKSKRLDEIGMGKNVNLYFDSNGNVGYYTSEKSEKEFYTYLRKVMLDESTGENVVLLRIILPDGTWKTAGVGKSIEYDGTRRKQADFVKFVEQGGIKGGRPIRCKLDAEGNVILIESLEKYELGYERLLYKRSSRSFEGFCSVASDCAVFIVPGSGYEEDETMYELRNAGYFNEGANYNMQVYEVGDELVAEVVVIAGSGKETTISEYEPLMVVKNVYQTEVDGEVCTAISAVTVKGEYTGIVREATVEFCDQITGKYMTFDKIQDGDVIRVLTDSSGKIINGERLVDIEKFKVDKYSGIYINNPGYRDYAYRAGYVYTMKDGLITVPRIINPDFTDANIRNQLFVHSAQAATALVYDVEEETVRSGGAEDIIAYKDCDDLDAVSFVYLITTLGDPRSMMIFK